jgi:hypothetical protein
MQTPRLLTITGALFLFSCGSNSASLLIAAVSQTVRGEGPETITATVDKVFLVSDGKYSSIHYQITWRGQQVIVEDPIHSTNYKVGDRIGVLILRHDMSSTKEPDGQKLIHFHALPYVPAPKP